MWVRHVAVAGHTVYELVDELGLAMRVGLFVDREAVVQFCRDRGWVLQAEPYEATAS